MRVLAVIAAPLDLRSEAAAALLRGLERMQGSMGAPLAGGEQAVRLAAVIARTGLDLWDDHVASVADASVCAAFSQRPAVWRTAVSRSWASAAPGRGKTRHQSCKPRP